MTRNREPKDVVTGIRLVPLRRADGTSDESGSESNPANIPWDVGIGYQNEAYPAECIGRRHVPGRG